MSATCIETRCTPTSTGSESRSSDLQDRMPQGLSLPLIYMLMVLLVLNVEIVVPTADQYAHRLGASESFSGLVIALTPFWQGILGVPLNYLMLRPALPSLRNGSK